MLVCLHVEKNALHRSARKACPTNFGLGCEHFLLLSRMSYNNKRDVYISLTYYCCFVCPPLFLRVTFLLLLSGGCSTTLLARHISTHETHSSHIMHLRIHITYSTYTTHATCATSVYIFYIYYTCYMYYVCYLYQWPPAKRTEGMPNKFGFGF